MVWQPSGRTLAPEGGAQEVRTGTYRQSMETNALLSRAELGQIKKCQFNNPAPGHVFGYAAAKDPEGAREVTMLWKEHRPTPPQSVVHPVADFKTLNKLATDRFRKDHMVTLKSPDERTKKLPTLPSSKNQAHTYGMTSAHRTAEVVRSFGPEEPPVKHLMQGAYYDEWVSSSLQKEAATSRDRPYIPPQPTKAVLGHSYGASRYLQPHSTEELWKMSKFKTVPPRVTAYMTGASPWSGASGAAGDASGYGAQEDDGPNGIAVA